MVTKARKETSARALTGVEELEQEVRRLLDFDMKIPGRLRSRENSRLEYKETFHWNSKSSCAKAIAAFANNVGGFLVFGVKNSPHEIVGVNIERFDSLDPAIVTG